jgi:hypothetical protein
MPSDYKQAGTMTICLLSSKVEMRLPCIICQIQDWQVKLDQIPITQKELGGFPVFYRSNLSL